MFVLFTHPVTRAACRLIACGLPAAQEPVGRLSSVLRDVLGVVS